MRTARQGMKAVSLAAIVLGSVLATTGTAPAITSAGQPPSGGPLQSTGSDATLNCTTSSTESDWLAFFSSERRIPAVRSCGTVVSVRNVGLFGPRELADTGGSIGGTTLRPYTPLGQRVITPAQSADGSRQVVTTVALPGTALKLIQRDSYRNGDRSMRTSVRVRNEGSAAAEVVLYRTGDCFPGSDDGYGIKGVRGIGCQQAVQHPTYAIPSPAPAYMRWEPSNGTSRFIVGTVAAVRSAIATGAPLDNHCDCRTPGDIAAALSWTRTIPSGGHADVAHRLTMSARAGRAGSLARASFTDANGQQSLVAQVTVNDHPVAGGAVNFVVGSNTRCRAVTNALGVATCAWTGPAPKFQAWYLGDAWRRPSRAAFAPATPSRPIGFAGFPACAQFDRTGFALVSSSDAHHELIGATTLGPPCPGVIYRATLDGATLAKMPGDRRTVTWIGDRRPGFVSLYVGTAYSTPTQGCHRIESIDTRTGAVVDSYTAPNDPMGCITEVAGQKFR